jgi:hypothetical protein
MTTEDATVEDWITMYRQGIGAAGITTLCNVPDILDVLAAISDAKRADPSLEPEHLANLQRQAREVERKLARAREFTPSWQRRLEELTAFHAEHGRMPRQTGGDASETSLGRWLHAQRSKVGKGTLEPRQREALDAIGNWDSASRERRDQTRFPENLKELQTFRRRHRRWPTYMNRGDEHEMRLGTWLFTLRQAVRDGRLPAEFEAALDAAVPGWNPLTATEAPAAPPAARPAPRAGQPRLSSFYVHRESRRTGRTDLDQRAARRDGGTAD